MLRGEQDESTIASNIFDRFVRRHFDRHVVGDDQGQFDRKRFQRWAARLAGAVVGGDAMGRLLRFHHVLCLGVLQGNRLAVAHRLVRDGDVSGQHSHVGVRVDPTVSFVRRSQLGGFAVEKTMTRKQQLGVWLLLTALLAIAAYRWWNLP
jgi:hypothetical protein